MTKAPISIVPAPTTRHFVASKAEDEATVHLELTYQQMDALRDLISQARDGAKVDADERNSMVRVHEQEAGWSPNDPKVVAHTKASADLAQRHLDYVLSFLADCDRVLGMFPDGQR